MCEHGCRCNWCFSVRREYAAKVANGTLVLVSDEYRESQRRRRMQDARLGTLRQAVRP